MATSLADTLVDDEGVWIGNGSGRRLGILWDKVWSVSGYKLDGVTTEYMCLVFDTEYGEYFEVYTESSESDALIPSIEEHLSNVSPDWQQRVMGLGIDDPPYQIWQRMTP